MVARSRASCYFSLLPCNVSNIVRYPHCPLTGTVRLINLVLENILRHTQSKRETRVPVLDKRRTKGCEVRRLLRQQHMSLAIRLVQIGKQIQTIQFRYNIFNDRDKMITHVAPLCLNLYGPNTLADPHDLVSTTTE